MTEAVAVRRETYEHAGAAELDLQVESGRIEVRLDGDGDIEVEVRHDPAGAGSWASGLAGVMSWLGGAFGEQVDASPDEAVRQTRVDLVGGRLVVHTPKAMHLRAIPLSVTVRAGTGSHVQARTGSGAVTVTGDAGRLDVTTGSGQINADRASGVASVVSGSGPIRLGPMTAGVRARTGSGTVEVSAVGGVSQVSTGTGDVWLGGVSGDVMARTGSGNVTVANASAGSIELVTGTGQIRVGVKPGVRAKIDLSSSSGSARSDIPLGGPPDDGVAVLTINGRTGSGNVLVTAADEH